MEFPANLKTNFYNKGAILLRKDSISKYAHKVVKGCQKSYVIDHTGKEHILQFAPEDWLISDLDSFVNNKPWTLFIEAIEDSEVICFDKSDFEIFESLDKKVLLEQIRTLRRNIIATNKRLTMFLCSTGEERYLDFIQTYPTLMQRLPLKLIASYIGVTPVYLSEIRKKLAGK